MGPNCALGKMLSKRGGLDMTLNSRERPSRPVYLLARLMMGVMTGLASLTLPQLWLHPLGPLTKNLPMAVLLWLLARRSA